MFRLDLGSTQRYCDGVSRRSFLQLGMAGMALLAPSGRPVSVLDDPTPITDLLS